MATEPVDDRPTWRDLCIHSFPEVERFEDVEELVADGGYGSLRGFAPRESQVYHHLYNELRGPPLNVNCIKEAVAASSTDNPDESIDETLHPGTRKLDDDGFSYWSSTGQEEPDVPESLVYRLSSPLCSVHEVQIRPFEANFQKGRPIYSASEVRFRLGHPYKHSPNYGTNGSSGLSEYVWTYTSPKFQMKQESTLQSFKLPRPVLCIGGILQVELLGREHRQHSDNKYYIRYKNCINPLCSIRSNMGK